MTDSDETWRCAGVIFDLDGTLVDNMSLHADSFEHFVHAHGLPSLDAAMRRRLDGRRNRDIFPILFDRELEPELLKQYSSEKESHYRELSRGILKPLAGLVDFLDALTKDALPFAIATSAPAENVEHNLHEIGLRDRFEVIVRSDQVPHGKPHPDVFLRAAELLGVEPSACLAFEDAPAGIEAAGAAGMRCCGITTSFSATMLGATYPLVAAMNDYLGVLDDPRRLGLHGKGE